ncbi:MAG TPA: class I SAM-dependent methyltransferase, partial [Nitrospiraceae bacterium]|nr:class I SAM-dependent methyltransferase [Nitrospiraceae bacterium]
SFFYRLSDLINGLLPALLSPAQLTKLLQDNYRASYPENVDLTTTNFERWRLLDWEIEVLDRYDIRSGRMLVLGAGWGREALDLARKGISVVGIDTNFAAIRTATRIAQSTGIPIRFHQADLLALPYASASFGYAILSDIMYSAVPGKSRRQAWLRDLSQILLPGGLVILSFLTERRPISRLKTLCRRVNQVLVTLPGASATYQLGDDCTLGHFLHAFQDEDEIRTELIGTGVIIRELDWKRGFAVLAYPPRTNPLSTTITTDRELALRTENRS